MKKQCDKNWLYYNYVVLNRSRKDIAKECNVSEATIKTHLIKKGIVKNKKYDKYEKEYLYDLYIIQKKTIPQIAQILNCSEDTVYYQLNKFKIKEIKKYEKLFTKEEMQEIIFLYTEKKWSAEQLAKKYNTEHNTIIKYLKNNNIKTRNLSESQWNYNNKIFPDILLDKAEIEDLYLNKRMSKKDLGKMFNCDPNVINRILKMHNIPIRGNSESHIGLQANEKHHNWKGGLCPLMNRCREFFQTNLAPKIRERDFYSCQLCGSKQNLHVHHIITFSEIINEIISP